MKPLPRWLKRTIDAAKAYDAPLPWTAVRATRHIPATNAPIRTTLRPEGG